MKNRNVGFLIIGLAVVIGVLVLLFNNAMTNIVNTSCSHGPECTMYDNIRTQTYISIALISIIVIIGLVLVFAKESERIILKTKTLRKVEKKKIDLSGLGDDEKRVVKILQNENGAIFQNTLMEKIGVGKVGITRLLDKLEAKQIIERKRRGMNNIVVLR
ncbi:MAG: hypothetical protein WCP89_03530 [archaeon]